MLQTAKVALDNVRDRVQDGRVTITLSYLDDLIALDLEDDSLCSRQRKSKVDFGDDPRLYMLQEHIEKLGGMFVVEGNPGNGSMLTVQVPI